MPYDYGFGRYYGANPSGGGTSGNGPFGTVPAPISVPNPAGDLARQVPGLANLNAGASNAINAGLQGQLSPATMNALKTAAAQWGVGAGLAPGSGLETNSLFGNIAGFAEKLKNEAIQNYNQFVPTVSRTQTVDPALQAEIADRNAKYAAAPDPAAAQNYAQSLFDKYLAQQSGGRPRSYGGGGGGMLPGSVARSAGGSLFGGGDELTSMYDAPWANSGGSGSWAGPGAGVGGGVTYGGRVWADGTGPGQATPIYPWPSATTSGGGTGYGTGSGYTHMGAPNGARPSGTGGGYTFMGDPRGYTPSYNDWDSLLGDGSGTYDPIVDWASGGDPLS